MKKCIKCNASKPLDEFYDKGKYKDNSCIPCRSNVTRERRASEKLMPKKKCTSCKKTFKMSAFSRYKGKSKDQCIKCCDKAIPKKKLPKCKDDRKLESIFEAEHRLKKDAKKIAYNNVEVEKEKIKSGYSWVNDVINPGTAFESRVRVLRKKQSA